MTMKHLAVGDLGTSGIKIGLVNEKGEVVESIYFPTRYSAKGLGRIVQQSDDFVEGILKGIRLLFEKSRIAPNNIVALALSGQMGGIIGVDKEFRNLTGLDMGLDLHSERYNRFFQEKYANFVNTKSCGSPRNFPKILWWKHERPEVYKKVARFVTLNGYVVGRLAGMRADKAFIDYTTLSFFGNEEMEKKQWSEEVTRDLGIDLTKLPQIVEPWQVVGKVSPESASSCGLLSGTPIVAGLGDQPAGFLGGGLNIPGMLADVAGSSTILSLFVDKPVRQKENPTVMYMIAAQPSGYHAFTYINGGGTTIHWFIDTFLSDQEGTSESQLQWITKKSARVPPGSEGLLFLPYFGGQQCPYNPSVRGAFIGLSWWHKKEHLFRSILESIAYDYALGLEALRATFPRYPYKQIFAMGGGARNELWNHIKANVLGLPYIPIDDYKFPLLGCAIVAGYGIGLFSKIAPLKRKDDLFHNSVIQPNASLHHVYKQYCEIYANLLHQPLRSSFQALALLSEEVITNV
ncbi:FGGY-family carbohydrate kinase [Atrimonas thermophila]|uniref:FGGY-family carbohydrate kinase n=1 Tax=Atrimonas thermophila TaxID=3064161 RepID=UPI00399C5587